MSLIFCHFDQLLFWQGGGGMPKCLKILSDKFSRHYSQFETFIFYFWRGENSKTISDQFSCHFSQYETTLIFFIFWRQLGLDQH